jgi:hypothetical protein
MPGYEQLGSLEESVNYGRLIKTLDPGLRIKERIDLPFCFLHLHIHIAHRITFLPKQRGDRHHGGLHQVALNLHLEGIVGQGLSSHLVGDRGTLPRFEIRPLLTGGAAGQELLDEAPVLARTTARNSRRASSGTSLR